MQGFSILKSFSVVGKSGRVTLIKEFIWYPPLCNWIKCNTDGVAKAAPTPAACRLGCFAENLRNTFALHAELIGAMLAVEIALGKGWHNLWLECDSTCDSGFQVCQCCPLVPKE